MRRALRGIQMEASTRKWVEEAEGIKRAEEAHGGVRIPGDREGGQGD